MVKFLRDMILQFIVMSKLNWTNKSFLPNKKKQKDQKIKQKNK
ncbi:MAG: hypothetical protein KatS3mg092_0310 [Patescibacteria group bacterium]|nr:MAG: hypothetical protein KatS3mg092_0310 [Patescibacteria group bacterium]